MTTVLLSILNGVLGLVIGFTIGIKWSAFRAFRFGKWKICNFKDSYRNGIYNILGESDNGNLFSVMLTQDGDVSTFACTKR